MHSKDEKEENNEIWKCPDCTYISKIAVHLYVYMGKFCIFILPNQGSETQHTSFYFMFEKDSYHESNMLIMGILSY